MDCSNIYAPNETDSRRDMIDHEQGSRKVKMMPLERIVPRKSNARTHSKRQIQQIADSIRRFGFTNPVLIDDAGEIMAGHGRVAAAKLLGLSAVPTLRISHLSPVEQRAYAIADNRLAEQSSWDRNVLAIELQALVDLEFDVELTGFAADEIALIVEHRRDDKAKSKPRVAHRENQPCAGAAVSRLGDEWLLGNHRLVCGDGDMIEADAVLRQWEVQTGREPILTATGQTLSEVRAQREPAALASGASLLSHSAAMSEVQ